MVTTNSLLVGSDITIHFSHIQKIIGSRKYRHTSLPMLFPCIFEISTHMGPLEETKKEPVHQQFLKMGISVFVFL